MNPPPISMEIVVLKQQPTGVYHCKLVITRLPDPTGLSQATDSPFTLICGCANTDELLLWRHMKLEKLEAPMEVRSWPRARASSHLGLPHCLQQHDNLGDLPLFISTMSGFILFSCSLRTRITSNLGMPYGLLHSYHSMLPE